MKSLMERFSSSVTSDTLRVQCIGPAPMRYMKRRAVWDALYNGGEAHDAEGCTVQLEAALVRSGTEAYVLAIRLGDALYEVGEVKPFDPGVKDLPIKRFGLSRAEIQQQEHSQATARAERDPREYFEARGINVVKVGTR